MLCTHTKRYTHTCVMEPKGRVALLLTWHDVPLKRNLLLLYHFILFLFSQKTLLSKYAQRNLTRIKRSSVRGVTRGRAGVARFFEEIAWIVYTGIEVWFWGRVDWTTCDARCSVVACETPPRTDRSWVFLWKQRSTRVAQHLLSPLSDFFGNISCGYAKVHVAFRNSSTCWSCFRKKGVS